MEQYSINLECFQGPMELLMHLIDKNKIDIYQDRVDNSLRIESSDYEKEQKEIDDIQPEL